MHTECQKYVFFRGFKILTYNLMKRNGHGCIYQRMFILSPERIMFEGIPPGNRANIFNWT